MRTRTIFRIIDNSSVRPNWIGHVDSDFYMSILKTKDSQPISLKLGENKLTIGNNGDWSLESSDLQNASSEILRLSSEKEVLINHLSESYDHIDSLKNEVLQLNEIKSKLLDMVWPFTKLVQYLKYNLFQFSF